MRPLFLGVILLIVGGWPMTVQAMERHQPRDRHPISQPTPRPPDSTCGSLQALIDAAPAGSTLNLPACIYRETVSIRKPLTIDGHDQAEIRGSDVWSGWLQNGSNWMSSLVYPDVGSDSTAGPGAGYLDMFRAFNLEQVFVDGVPLERVASSPTSGQFALDATRHVILPGNPNSHTVEVTTRKRWINTLSDNVVLTNLTFRDAATGAYETAVSSDLHRGFVVSNSTLSDAHGSMAGAGGQVGSGEHYVNDTFVNAGDVALSGYRADQVLAQGNTFIHTGYGGWDPAWQAGAVKFSSTTNLTLDSNSVSDAFGMGLWCDIHCSNVVISKNKVHDVGDVGIHFEISNGAHIFGNAVWDVGSRVVNPGIFISNSGDTEVDHNTVYNANGPALFVYDANRTDTGIVQNNSLHDNYAIQTIDDGAHWGLGFGGFSNVAAANTNEHGSNNAFWYPVPEGGAPRFWWAGIQTPQLAVFNGTPGGGGTSYYLSDAQKDQALSAAGIPH